MHVHCCICQVVVKAYSLQAPCVTAALGSGVSKATAGYRNLSLCMQNKATMQQHTTSNKVCGLQKEEAEFSKGKLQQLEQRYQAQQAKLQHARDEVAKAKDAVANLPAAPENTKPQQDALQGQIKDLNLQVS